ncbi:hypothetical protein RRG08_036684 [Elysia crispata]|uniref:Replication origin-binding protein n=1 Tax=Elysia crispata TaxID=231223 RepID=A0AAE1AEZ3_9GAST|nr:hypothetical protein RRG08_036684 [Elysia crispata]
MRKRRLQQDDTTSIKKKKKNVQPLTPQGVVKTAVVEHLVTTLYGFPFNSHIEIENCTIHKLNRRFMRSDDVTWAMREFRNVVVAIKSPMNSGKTTMVLEIMRDYDRTLVISSSRSYSDYMCTVVPGLVHYRNLEGAISADKHPRIVVQVQSLRRIKKIKTETTFAQWDLVYLDEPNGCMHQANSSLSRPEERIESSKYMRKILSNTPAVLVTDAGLAHWHVSALRRHLLSGLQNRPIHCFVNEFIPRTHTIKVLTCTMYTNAFMPTMKAKVGADNCTLLDLECLVMSMNRSEARNIFIGAVDRAYRCHSSWGTADICQYLRRVLVKDQADLIATYLRKKVLKNKDEVVLLTSNTSVDIKEYFMKDPERFLVGKRCLIHTTCINVGVDLNFEWAERTFLIVDRMSPEHTPALIDLYQAVGRNRRSKELNVYIRNRRKTPENKDDDDDGRNFFDAEHMKMVLNPDDDTSFVSSWEPPPKDMEKIYFNAVDEDGLNAVVRDMEALERKSCNRSPRLFFDVLMTLLERTLQMGDVVFRDTQTVEWQKEFAFFSDPEELREVVTSCNKVFTDRLTKYTTLSPMALEQILTMSSTRTEKRNLLKDIAETIKIIDGKFSRSFYLLHNLNKNLLKQWALIYNKFELMEPSSTVDLLNYEEELAVEIDPEMLMERVRVHLYKNNTERYIRSYDDFMRALKYATELMTSARPLDEVINGLYRLLVDELCCTAEREKTMSALAHAAGFLMFTDKQTSVSRFTMPMTKLNVDIHKMAAMLAL